MYNSKIALWLQSQSPSHQSREPFPYVLYATPKYLRKLRYRLDTGQQKSSSPLSNSAMSLLKKYEPFFNPRNSSLGSVCTKASTEAAYRCAAVTQRYLPISLDKSKTYKFSRRYFIYAFFDIRKRKIFRSNDPV
ncbi:hypothetical protein TNCV_2579101 [Trichonephila clavipes]|nr:hypothetical protein TNCV_2579101 [Trichonephila clavipes]